jgi:hypothetical protein
MEVGDREVQKTSGVHHAQSFKQIPFKSPLRYKIVIMTYKIIPFIGPIFIKDSLVNYLLFQFLNSHL